MRITAYTQKEELLKEIELITYSKEGIRVIRLEDEESTLYQIISDKSIKGNTLMDLGIMSHNPNINVNDKGEILITIIIEKQ